MTYDWNDYKSWPLPDLIALHSAIKSTPESEMCDNYAPGTCCHECNFYEIGQVLTKRLSMPVVNER